MKIGVSQSFYLSEPQFAQFACKTRIIISVGGIKQDNARKHVAHGELSMMVSVTSLPGGNRRASTLNFSPPLFP